jgi:hypothetical protein
MPASASGVRRPAVGFHFVAGHLGAGVYTGLSVAGDKSRNADTSFRLFKKEQVWWRLFSRASPPLPSGYPQS